MYTYILPTLLILNYKNKKINEKGYCRSAFGVISEKFLLLGKAIIFNSLHFFLVCDTSTSLYHHFDLKRKNNKMLSINSILL